MTWVILFIAGFTIVFVSVAMLGGTLGRFFIEYADLLTRVLGVVIILLGLVFIGAFGVAQRTVRPQVLWPQVSVAPGLAAQHAGQLLQAVAVVGQLLDGRARPLRLGGLADRPLVPGVHGHLRQVGHAHHLPPRAEVYPLRKAWWLAVLSVIAPAQADKVVQKFARRRKPVAPAPDAHRPS